MSYVIGRRTFLTGAGVAALTATGALDGTQRRAGERRRPQLLRRRGAEAQGAGARLRLPPPHL